MKSEKDIEIIESIKQLNLYGYGKYFNSFRNLYKKDKLPNVILLSGQKGLGKSTFAYHFINFLLSNNETDKYSYENFSINSDNNSFKLIQTNIDALNVLKDTNLFFSVTQ